MCKEHEIEPIVQPGPYTFIYGCKNCDFLYEEVLEEAKRMIQKYKDNMLINRISE